MAARSRKSRQEKHGFEDDGKRYVVRDVHLIESADADLWNDRMYVQVDHRGQCRQAWFLQPNQTQYAQPLRCVYLRDDDTGQIWSAPFDPVQAEPDEFEFSAGLADLRWRVVFDELEVTLQLALPRRDTVELWSASVRNTGRRKRHVSVYGFFPVGSIGALTHTAQWDAKLNGMVHKYFPYYVRWEDYYELRKLRNNVVCLCDTKPTSVETNLNRFLGGLGLHNPKQLSNKRLGGSAAYHEPSAAVLQFSRTLHAGNDVTVRFVFGPARDRQAMNRLKRRYLREGGMDRAVRRAYRFLESHSPAVRVTLPDEPLQHYLNHWQPRRALMLGRTVRLTACPQGRNAIQDAMGAVYTNPGDARKWFGRIWAHQNADGWLPHGMPMHPKADIMPITRIPHRDTNVWGPLALKFYLAETGDRDALHERIPFADEGTGTLYEHICKGLEWLLRDRSERGLSHLGQGDWNDPLNMAGRYDKGESVWLTEALAVALSDWADVAEFADDPARASRYRKLAEECRAAVNEHAWTGRWYARGTTDEGEWFGTPDQNRRAGKIFLNAQSWALMAHLADEDRQKALLRSVDRRLMTPAGPMTLAPAFTDMDEAIGKITQKAPGTGENGSVYCHAVTFYAYALLASGHAQRGYDMLRNLLVGTRDNPIDRAGQLPLYVPNYFRGTPSGASAGSSSHSPNTGTSAWYYRTAIAMLLGVRGELDGLRIDPRIPDEWKSASVWRKWRDAEFDIDIKRSKKVKSAQVLLDGQPQADNLIPPQPAGSKHHVIVLLP